MREKRRDVAHQPLLFPNLIIVGSIRFQNLILDLEVVVLSSRVRSEIRVQYFCMLFVSVSKYTVAVVIRNE